MPNIEEAHREHIAAMQAELEAIQSLDEMKVFLQQFVAALGDLLLHYRMTIVELQRENLETRKELSTAIRNIMGVKRAH